MIYLLLIPFLALDYFLIPIFTFGNFINISITVIFAYFLVFKNSRREKNYLSWEVVTIFLLVDLISPYHFGLILLACLMVIVIVKFIEKRLIYFGNSLQGGFLFVFLSVFVHYLLLYLMNRFIFL